MTLNPQQQRTLETVMNGGNVFITGPGGTGKTFLIRRILNECALKNKKVAVTALTGCAALLLGEGAKTVHSWAGIGLGKDPAPKIAQEIRKTRRDVLYRWLTTRVLIIDEVSMMSPDLLSLLSTVGQLVRKSPLFPFGGIQVILVGDFAQLPPVIKDEDKNGTPLLFETDIWHALGLTICPLTQIVRQADPVFQKVLDEIRMGDLTDESLQVLLDRQSQRWDDLKIKPTLLFSRRADVEMVNMVNFKALKGRTCTYDVKTLYDASSSKGLTDSDPDVKRAIGKLDRDAPYQPHLELKIGTQVMLVYNVSTEEGLVNGSRGVVEGFTETVPSYPRVLFKGKTESLIIMEQSWKVEGFDGIKRSQIPLILGYAATIHKCQGATLDCALIDIGPSTFEVGQAYVALSRVKSLDSLYIYDFEPSAIKAHPKVVNFYTTLASKQDAPQNKIDG
jgi:ATP-dependent DNA helicase PIF1